MSENLFAEPAIETLRERARALELEARVIAGRLEEVRELIAMLESRKPRAPRKPRAVAEATGEPPGEDPY